MVIHVEVHERSIPARLVGQVDSGYLLPRCRILHWHMLCLLSMQTLSSFSIPGACTLLLSRHGRLHDKTCPQWTRRLNPHSATRGLQGMSTPGELHEPGHVLGHLLRDVGFRLVMQGRAGSIVAGSPAIVCILLQLLHLGICRGAAPCDSWHCTHWLVLSCQGPLSTLSRRHSTTSSAVVDCASSYQHVHSRRFLQSALVMLCKQESIAW